MTFTSNININKIKAEFKIAMRLDCNEMQVTRVGRECSSELTQPWKEEVDETLMKGGRGRRRSGNTGDLRRK